MDTLETVSRFAPQKGMTHPQIEELITDILKEATLVAELAPSPLDDGAVHPGAVRAHASRARHADVAEGAGARPDVEDQGRSRVDEDVALEAVAVAL